MPEHEQLPADGSTDAFHGLIADITRILGPSSGINSEDVDPSDLQSLMRRYTSSENEWGKFALNDRSRSYVRNLIDRGNGKANILLLVWNPGRGSLVHDHSNAHCIMKVLKGSLKETLYHWPDQNLVDHGESSPLSVQKETVYRENDVTYISGELLSSRVPDGRRRSRISRAEIGHAQTGIPGIFTLLRKASP